MQTFIIHSRSAYVDLFISIALCFLFFPVLANDTVHHREQPVPLLTWTADVPIENASLIGINNRHSRRISRVNLDANLLLLDAKQSDGMIFAEEGAKQNSPRILANVVIEPFQDEQYHISGRYVEQWTDETWTWVGQVNGHEHSEFILTVTDTSHFGIMRVGPIVYEFRAGADGNAYVNEPDIASYNLESACKHGLNHDHVGGERTDHTQSSDTNPQKNQSPARGSGSTSVIDVLLLYSSAAASNYDIEALANTSIASMNTSFDLGGIDAVARIVHYAEVSGYTEASPMDFNPEIVAVAADMRAGNGDFSGVPTLRNTHKADLAMMLWDGTEMGDSCGGAFTVGTTSGDDTFFTANTGDSCIAMFNNFTHELGHNLGSDHDYPATGGVYTYSNGRSFSGDMSTPAFRTIMGSAAGCSVSGCDRLNRWSDPGASYYSENLGVSGQSDNVSSHDAMRSEIADYRTPSGSVPGSMGTVTVTRGLCYAANWISWSAPSGLIGWYEVQIDDNSGFSSPSTFYRGVKTWLPLSAYSTTWVRARTCNSLGCNGWENGNQTATYTSGCS